jgi:23S rRNA pseudouridine2605 synthase
LTASTAERLHKRIAASGICSRRAAEVLIAEGRVAVNGEVVTAMGVLVTPDDLIEVDGEAIGFAKTYTLVMNKPVGVVTTLSDPQGRPTVKRLLPDLGVQIKPVGRLDMESEGLLLFTNDGELANRLTHPRYKVDKEYEVVVTGHPDEKDLERLRKGVYIEGGTTAPAEVERKGQVTGTTQTLRITIHEGRKRQVRLMCDAIGHPVVNLKRVRIGPLVLRKLPRGACRMLTQSELAELRKAVKMRD